MLPSLPQTRKSISLSLFVIISVVIGIVTLVRTHAASPAISREAEQNADSSLIRTDSTASNGQAIQFGGIVKLRLVAPGWRPMAVTKDAAIAKADKFTEIIDGVYYDPTEPIAQKRQKAIDPAELQARGARVYNYTLGPYVTNTYVPCDLLPPAMSNYSNTCLTDTRMPADLKSLFDSGQMTMAEWRKAIARTRTDDPSNPLSPGCDAAPTSPSLTAVYACKFANNFLIYPNSAPWMTYMDKKLVPDSLMYGGAMKYDGVFADSVGSNPGEFPAKYLDHTPLRPAGADVDPVASDPYYSSSAWLDASKQSLVGRQQTIANINTQSGLSKVLALNGLESGDVYWASCSDIATIQSGNCAISPESTRNLLINGLHAAMSESIFRPAGGGINLWNNSSYLASWIRDVEMIRDVQRRGLKGYWWTKCWTTTTYSCKNDTSVPNAAQLITQWRRFVVASYLLGAGDKSYMNFDTSRNDNDSAEYFTDYDHALSVGTTSNSNNYSQIGSSGIYMRSFSNGLVLVNPDKVDKAASVSLPAGTYKLFDGSQITVPATGYSITLPAHTGEIMVRQ